MSILLPPLVLPPMPSSPTHHGMLVLPPMPSSPTHHEMLMLSPMPLTPISSLVVIPPTMEEEEVFITHDVVDMDKGKVSPKKEFTYEEYVDALNTHKVVGDRLVLPCFNQLSTGTCAHGRYCQFLHDRRLKLSEDIHDRKLVEKTLNHHLQQLRPVRTKTGKFAGRSGCLFFYPSVPMSHTNTTKAVDTNVGIYLPKERDTPEWSMWLHLCMTCTPRSMVLQNYHNPTIKTSPVTKKPRLPVFRALSLCQPAM